MMMVEQHERISAALRVRRALALPIYTTALILSFASDLLGDLAAMIAGDDVGG
jgi:hypothetical protein